MAGGARVVVFLDDASAPGSTPGHHVLPLERSMSLCEALSGRMRHLARRRRQRYGPWMAAEPDDNNDYREALRQGLRRAGLHWVRASYEVIAGVGAFLDEVARTRRESGEDDGVGRDDDGPVRIELD